MSKSDNSFRHIIEQYVNIVEDRGFSVVDFIFELLKDRGDFKILLNRAYKSILIGEKIESDIPLNKEQYYKLAELLLTPEKPINRDALLRGIHILYTIHQKEYIDYKNFLEILHRDYKMPNTISTRNFVLGHDYGYLYPGLRVAIMQYKTHSSIYWNNCNYEERLSILEEIESSLYKDMLTYKAKEL